MARPVEIRVLGCHGGEMAGFLTPSLLLDQNVLIDAGSFGRTLSLEQQLKLEHVLVSHSHHDHVKDLAEFADLIIGRRRKPVLIHASPATLKVIHQDFFNNRLWPDFFTLPSPDAPVLRGAPFPMRKPFSIGSLTIRAIPVSHPVESVGFVVRCPNGTFVYTGDTGPTEELWQVVNRIKELRLLMIETKFPNELQVVADAAGHLTPRTLAKELDKIQADGVPILLYHIKPDRYDEVIEQVEALGDKRIRIMKIGDRLTI
jgi:ribonuclease BN (tRNA processing enzyme)